MTTDAIPPDRQIKARSFLPPINTPKYHLLLGAVAIFILGPLGAISAAYMNFSLGFFVCGQVLAGILGGVAGSLLDLGKERRQAAQQKSAGAAAVPDDMSDPSLIGGGLIAGDSLAALSAGIYGLLATLFSKP